MVVAAAAMAQVLDDVDDDTFCVEQSAAASAAGTPRRSLPGGPSEACHVAWKHRVQRIAIHPYVRMACGSVYVSRPLRPNG
jgi:hypothetical protein